MKKIPIVFSIAFSLVCAKLHSQSPSVDTIMKMNVGGIGQTVLVRGSNVSNPLLLMLHGGPGFSEFIFFRSYNKELEKTFTVINWDQRGAHLSYNDSITKQSMIIEQFVMDAHELIVQLKRIYKKDKIYLLGHSWGSTIGLLVAQKYPEDIYAYVGAGQVVNGKQNEKLSLEYTLLQAKKRKNKAALEQLMTVQKEYPETTEHLLENLKIQRNWLEKFGGVFYGQGNYKMLFSKVSKKEKELYNEELAEKGEAFSMPLLWPQILQVNFDRSVQRVMVPVYFLAGRHDYNTPSIIADKYLKSLTAPYKKLIWFGHSGHFMPFEEPEKFNLIMNHIRTETMVSNEKKT